MDWVFQTIYGTLVPISDICTDHIISRFSANSVVAQSFISYVEHWLQTLMFHRYVFYEESKLGNYLSIVDNKNQRVLINQRKSSIFNPQNIGNPEKYRMQCQQDMYIIDFFDKQVGMYLGTLPMWCVLRNSFLMMIQIKIKSPPNYIVDHCSRLKKIMNDVLTIPINIQLIQELDSLCGQRLINALGLFYFCLGRIFFLWIIRCLSTN